MGFPMSQSMPFLRHVIHSQQHSSFRRLPGFVRHLSVGKDTESHLLPRLYVGPVFENAVPLKQFLSNPQQHTQTTSSLLKEGTIRPLSSDQSHYVTSVMRMLGPGRKQGRWTFDSQSPCCRIFDGQEEWVAQLDVLDDVGGGDTPKKKNRRRGKQDITVMARCLAPLINAATSPADSSTRTNPKIIPVLCFAPPKKKDRYQWIMEKSTELGMEAWLLLTTDRTESSSNRDYERKGQAYVLEAAEQCERQSIPPLLSISNEDETADAQSSALTSLSSLLEVLSQQREDTTNAANDGFTILICRERSSSSLPILQALEQIQAQSSGTTTTCLTLIGPEGGWSPKEEATFDSLCQEKPHMVQNVSLGPHVLRTDTAAVSAMASFAFSGDCLSSKEQ